MQTIHVLKVNRTTRPYSASAMEQEKDPIEFLIDSPYSNCSTDFRNDEICTAAETIFGVSFEYLKRSAGKLLKFLCRMSLISTDTEDHSLHEQETNDAVKLGIF